MLGFLEEKIVRVGFSVAPPLSLSLSTSTAPLTHRPHRRFISAGAVARLLRSNRELEENRKWRTLIRHLKERHSGFGSWNFQTKAKVL
ncbi:hypothetical protein V6N13_137326 [Hibiscus sabdariffa]|uniref:Uncharacterized protein n=1 Tax=Hibiscus sabdariffa TaxID=183260 RepID=A0ABR2DLV8_9ROSI